MLYLVSRRSPITKKFLIHATAIGEVFVHMFTVLTETSLSVLAINGIQMVFDVVISWIDTHVSTGHQQDSGVQSMTFAELNDLLYYEELSDEEEDYSQTSYSKSSGIGSRLSTSSGSQASMRRRMRQHMHQYIPPHIFRATVRVKSETSSSESMGGGAGESQRGRSPRGGSSRGGGQSHSVSAASSRSGSSSSSIASISSDRSSSVVASPVPDENLLCPSENEEEDDNDGEGDEEGRKRSETIDEFESPASFPCTPFSRAQVMNKNAEKVISTIFSARDILRMELLSTSRDEYSRRAAAEARTSKKMAIFDSVQTSDGLALTCGNHCLMKAGKGLCYSSRSMLPIRRDAYVYFEFSVTASNKKQVPVLAIGVSTPSTPLSTMAGSSALSFGLHSDGRVLIGSKWHTVKNGVALSAGNTVGFLIYMGSDGGAGLSPPPKARGGHQSPEREHDSISSHSLSLSPERGASSESSSANPNLLSVNVNGIVLELDARAHEAVKDVLSASTAQSAPLYPTVSLMSPNVRVWCRFCEADILQRKAAAIGAPDNARVYCLDGSVA